MINRPHIVFFLTIIVGGSFFVLALLARMLNPASLVGAQSNTILSTTSNSSNTRNLPTSSVTLEAGRSHSQELTVDGLKRMYRLYVPEGARDGEALPLIVVLHGTYGTGQKMERALGFNQYANREKFFVAYPDAYTPEGERSTARWNDGRGTLASSTRGVDDVKFLRALVDDAGRRVPIDNKRLFVTGASNGGMMTYRIGCEAADLFAGIAPVIGNIPTPIFPSCTPSRAVGLLAINGDADPFVPFTGGEVCSGISKRFCEGGNVASQQKSVSVFASKAGCDLTPMREDLVPKVSDGTTVEKETYSSCAKNISVGAYIVHGGGHAWPPRASQLSLLGSSRAGISSKNLDATAVITDFFMGFGK